MALPSSPEESTVASAAQAGVLAVGPRDYLAFVRSRQHRWRRLEALCREMEALARDPARDTEERRLAALDELDRLFRLVGADLARSRYHHADTALVLTLEALLARASQLLARPLPARRRAVVRWFVRDLPLSVDSFRGPILFSIALFCVGLGLGWVMVQGQPETASFFMSEEMIAGVRRGSLWIEAAFSTGAAVGFAQIFTNNVLVAFRTFAGGVFAGIGALFLVLYNGLSLGATFGFCALHGMADDLFRFVIAHGVLEMSLVLVAGGTGFGLGFALIAPGRRERAAALADVGRRGAQVMSGVALLLGVAAVVESFVSPSAAVPFAVKWPLGLALGGGWWLWTALGARRARAEEAPAGEGGERRFEQLQVLG